MTDDPFKTVKTDQLKPMPARAEPAKKEPAPAKPAEAAPKGTGAKAAAPFSARTADSPAGKPPRIVEQKATEVGKLFPLSEAAAKLLDDKQTLLPFLHLLIKRQLYLDAVRLLAHALPKAEGVWWACQCAKATAGKEPPANSLKAMQAAEKWVKEPSEENRRAAEAAAEAADLSTPAGCAALAAFWSGGSLAPPNVPVVPPAPTLTAQAVANTVLMAAVMTEPQKAPDKYFKFLAEGIQVANGTSRWA